MNYSHNKYVDLDFVSEYTDIVHIVRYHIYCTIENIFCQFGGIMKTERNIFVAFILNLSFSVFEFAGGVYTGSVAIISDAVHDIGDAVGIGVAFFLETKSKKQPDDKYTYGYSRYSIVGSAFTTLILLVGSVMVIYNAIFRIINPVEINYNGMIIYAIVGVCVNLCAALLTRHGDSLNQRAVNLHMLEDVLGWIVVLVGAIVMRFTDLCIIDPLMSIGVAVFIIMNALKNLKVVLGLFLEKTPHGINVGEITEHICEVDGVLSVHHIHVWSMDGHNNYATMHVVVNGDMHEIKRGIRAELKEHGIGHVTLELEEENEPCYDECCHVEFVSSSENHHHHHP